MALDYNSILFDSQIVSTGSNDDLFTLAADESVDNLVIRFTNYTGTAAKASAWCQASGGSDSNDDLFLNEYSIPADDYRDIAAPRMIGGGGKAKLTVTSDTGSALVVSLISGIKRS